MKKAALVLLVLLGESREGLPRQDEAKGREIPDFALDVLPVLTRLGCNAGTCHGAAKGQENFRLSLLGYDPDADHEALTLEHRSRRVNRARPDESLMILKPLGKLSHGGGRVLKADSPEHKLLLDWIRAGAPRKTRDETLVSVDAGPARVMSAGAEEALRVTATYSNGAKRDVTAQALFSTNDDAIATVTSDGRVKAVTKGETAIVVRYGGHVVSVLAGVPFGGRVEFAPANFIDEHLARKWTSLGIAPAAAASGAVFVRRAYLDLIGTLPTADEARAFVAKPDHAALVDALLARPEFASFWTLKFCAWLLVQEKAAGYPERIRAAIEKDEPLDQFVRALVTGDRVFAPADDPRLAMEFTIQAFHGFRMQCANCHNHPLERFSQDEYHSLAAVYARVRSDGARMGVVERGELTHPRTGKVVAPRLPDGTVAEGDRRVPFAAWLVRDRRFARAMANRLWAEVFGRGLVHPVDDMRASNPSPVPELLEALADEFAKSPRLRPFLRTLVLSRAYGLACGPSTHFASSVVKPLPAEVQVDAIRAVLGAGGPRAIERFVGTEPALEAFGRCPRTASCVQRGEFEGSLRQALHVMNDRALNDLLAAMKPPTVDELYWRALSRAPSEAERKRWGGLDEEGRRDLVWALLASKEFSFRH